MKLHFFGFPFPMHLFKNNYVEIYHIFPLVQMNLKDLCLLIVLAVVDGK